MKSDLSSICEYRKGKVDVSLLTPSTYISTENMISNKGGITTATTLPTIPQTQEYRKGDVLVSNIRPYFKKIWKAKFDGGCSNDVLVFAAKDGTDPDFLYYVLADDTFFEYSMAISKGTKMPRGDKASIMRYQVPSVELPKQRRIASILRSLDEKIELNTEINNNLVA
jgi:type I restriction enzyme S subunit